MFLKKTALDDDDDDDDDILIPCLSIVYSVRL